jgi:catechol 2,3-dioxygenase-like lactoylglutathione lyase family enzyme
MVFLSAANLKSLQRGNGMRAHFILYVADQQRSRDFYANVLQQTPTLDVPGMTEFQLGADHVLGLMPVSGIRRLLGSALTDPNQGNGIPRCELYLVIERPAEAHARAIRAGAHELSSLENRSWGHRAAYSSDLDGHVLVFAELSHPINATSMVESKLA